METTQPAMTAGCAVWFCQIMLDRVAQELEITKRVFSAIPDDKAEYRPDPHARSAWELAWHIAQTDVHFLDGIADMKLSLEIPYVEKEPKTIAELIEWYDKNLKRAAARVRALTPEQMLTPINFLGAFNFPAVVYIGFFNNHRVHHRGALSTYLRPMGSKVPCIYGASYDTPWAGPQR
jgi:uncharacterized damage-inducible protein DinB